MSMLLQCFQAMRKFDLSMHYSSMGVRDVMKSGGKQWCDSVVGDKLLLRYKDCSNWKKRSNKYHMFSIFICIEI